MRQLGPGAQVGRYTLEEVAGRGGMGVVYRARQLRPNRTVALKVIAPELAADGTFRARFERESNTAAQIEHPNVIPVYEVDEDQGLLYIVMRYVEGVDLRELIASEGRIEPGRATRLVAQVADALDAAHTKGLVHRDVKPANVLVTGAPPGEHLYLTDFGLTKHTSSESGMTESGMVVGTLDYIAPEQVMGGAVDARTDVYALGCVLYNALTGSVPYPRDSNPAKLYAQAHEPPPRMAPELGLPAALQDVIDRAMCKRIDGRYPSAGDLGRAAVLAAENRPPPGVERSVAVGQAAPPPAPSPTMPTTTPPPKPPPVSRPHPPRLQDLPPPGSPQPAAWATRAGAHLLDFLLVALPPLILGVITSGVSEGSGATSDQAGSAGAATWFLAFVVWAPIYGALTLARSGVHHGQTLGHQAVGVRVVRRDGLPIRPGWGAWREFLKWIVFATLGWFLLVVPFLNFFSPLWDARRTTYHDRITASFVVRA